MRRGLAALVTLAVPALPFEVTDAEDCVLLAGGGRTSFAVVDGRTYCLADH